MFSYEPSAVCSFFHETIHGLKTGDNTRYNNLLNTVFSVLSDYPEIANAVVSETMSRYAVLLNGDAVHNDALLDEEIIAHVLSKVLDTPKVLKSLAEKDMGRLEKLYFTARHFLDGAIDRYRKMDNGNSDIYSLAAEKFT